MTQEEATMYSEEIQKLLARAQQGDVTCLPELRTVLDTHPEIWQRIGDLADHAELTILRLIGRTSLLVSEAMCRRQAALKKELSGPTEPLPLEQLLIRRIAISHLQVHHADIELAEAQNKGDHVQCGHAERRLDGANKRYLHAIRELASVRKLLTVKAPQRPAGRPRKLVMAEEVEVVATSV